MDVALMATATRERIGDLNRAFRRRQVVDATHLSRGFSVSAAAGGTLSRLVPVSRGFLILGRQGLPQGLTFTEQG
jgi:hypothetical protein